MAAREVFEELGLTEYEMTALTTLFDLGRTTAPNLAEATDIPKARIYDVLDGLADAGYVEVIPGRPREYVARSPSDVLDRATENRRQSFEQFEQAIDRQREAFLSEFQSRYERATEGHRPAEELFRVVDVGDPSESGTQKIYHDAAVSVRVLSKGFEYFERIKPAFEDACARGVDVRIVLLSPARLTEKSREIQQSVVTTIEARYPSVSIRYSNEPLPWRGTIADSDGDGTAIMLVQEDDVPNHLRQAAITENESFVSGLAHYFDLVWETVAHDDRQANTP